MKNDDQKECATAPVRLPAFATSEKTSGAAARKIVSLPLTPWTCGLSPVWIDA